jgi:acyl-CoA hydrolase
MENHRLVLPEHLNHYGYLFGGYLLQWVDEASWIAASRDHPGCRFVTVGMDRVEFKRSVREGTILRLVAEASGQGRTSARYAVTVYADDLDTGEESAIFATQVSFVCLDREGRKQPLPRA